MSDGALSLAMVSKGVLPCAPAQYLSEIQVSMYASWGLAEPSAIRAMRGTLCVAVILSRRHVFCMRMRSLSSSVRIVAGSRYSTSSGSGLGTR